MAPPVDPLYIEVIRHVAPEQYALLPPAVISELIDHVVTQRGSVTPVPQGTNNISHADALQLIHDILVFTGTIIAVYKPQLPWRKSPSNSTLSEGMKRQIKELVDTRLGADGQKTRDGGNAEHPRE
jgi:hypothetical protein